MEKSKTYMNPYLAGILIGILMVAAYFFSGEGLGASGALRDVVAQTTTTIAPDYSADSNFFKKYTEDHEKAPIKTWLIFEILGVIAGAVISATIFGRLGSEIIKPAHITNKTRLIAAASGGVLFGIGSQLGRGCTSGMVMSGMSVLSLSGFIGLIAIFGGGYMIAFFFRKLWI